MVERRRSGPKLKEAPATKMSPGELRVLGHPRSGGRGDGWRGRPLRRSIHTRLSRDRLRDRLGALRAAATRRMFGKSPQTLGEQASTWVWGQPTFAIALDVHPRYLDVTPHAAGSNAEWPADAGAGTTTYAAQAQHRGLRRATPQRKSIRTEQHHECSSRRHWQRSGQRPALAKGVADGAGRVGRTAAPQWLASLLGPARRICRTAGIAAAAFV